MTEAVVAEVNKAIRLGITAKDAITGFSGIVIQRIDQFNGNTRFALQPKGEDESSYPEAIMIDQHMLDYVDEGVVDRVTHPTVVVNFKLGELVKDKATGFTGVATSACTFINGCVGYTVLPKAVKTDLLNDNSRENMIEAYRLERAGDGMVEVVKAPPVTPTTGKAPGGPSTRMSRPTAAKL